MMRMKQGRQSTFQAMAFPITPGTRSTVIRLVMLAMTACLMPAFAQDQRFVNYNMSDGLPSNIVYAVTESESGYMWFGSEAGISRFDGRQFQSLLLDRGGSASTAESGSRSPKRRWLPGASVQYLFSRQGKVYAALESAGLAVLDENLQLLQSISPESAPAMPSATIWSMAAAGPDHLWLGFSDAGLSLFDERAQTFTPYALPRPQNSNAAITPQSSSSIMFIHVDDNDTVWVAALGEGLLRKTAAATEFERVRLGGPDLPHQDRSLLPDYIRGIIHDDRFIYALSSEELFIIDKHSAQVHAVIDVKQHLGKQQTALLSIIQDRDGHFWLGSRTGLYRMRLNSELDEVIALQHFQHSPALPDSIGSDYVYFSRVDRNHGLWFVSIEGGVIHRPNGWEAFSLLRHNPLAETTLPDDRVRSLLADGRQLWIGTFTNGLVRYDLDSNTYTTPPALRKLTMNEQHAHRINAMMMDQEHRLWLGLTKLIVSYAEAEGPRIIATEADNSEAFSNRFISGMFATDQRTWVRWDSRYMMYFDSQQSLWRAYDLAPYFIDDTDQSIITHALLDGGDFLIATRKQILRYAAECHCMHDFIDYDQQPIQTMLVADRRLFLVRGDQLLAFSLDDVSAGDQPPQLQHSWSLPSDLTQAGINNLLLEDPETLWLTSSQAMLRLQLGSSDDVPVSLREITHSDGLPEMELEQHSLRTLEDGRLAIAGTEGVALLQPDLLNDDLPVPAVMLQQVRSNKGQLPNTEPGHPGETTAAQKLSLPYSENTLFINFQSILFTHREHLQFQYRLLGWEEDWISSGDTPQAIYSNLPHGDYRFEVRARLGRQDWGPINDRLQWTVNRPPWLSNAAISGYSVAALFLLTLAWQRRRQHQRQQQALALAGERQRFAHQQSELATRLNRSIQAEEIAQAIYESIHARMPLHRMRINFLADCQHWYEFPAKQAMAALDSRALYQQLQEDDSIQSLSDAAMAPDAWRDASLEHALLMPLGSHQPYRALAILWPLQSPDQEQLSFLRLASSMAGSAIDNCELLQQVTQLAETNRHANEAKSEFITMVSHEIRTPLHGLMGMLHLMGQHQNNAQRELMLDKVNHSSEQLLAVLDDVLDISKIEAKKIELRNNLFNLQQLCQNLEDLFLAKVQAKNIYLVCLLAPDLMNWRIGDQDRCLQILTNLVSNAIKFTDSGGIMVCLRKESHEHSSQQSANVLIEVYDTGIGIRQQDQQRLFQRFEQVGEMTWQRYGGSGLGLAISHHLCQTLGGHLSVASEPGQGSVFRASLPLPIPAELQPIDPLPSLACMQLCIACGKTSAGLATVLQGMVDVKVMETNTEADPASLSAIGLESSDEQVGSVIRLLLTTSVSMAKNSPIPAALLRSSTHSTQRQRQPVNAFMLPQQWQDLMAWILSHQPTTTEVEPSAEI